MEPLPEVPLLLRRGRADEQEAQQEERDVDGRDEDLVRPVVAVGRVAEVRAPGKRQPARLEEPRLDGHAALDPQREGAEHELDEPADVVCAGARSGRRDHGLSCEHR